MILRLDKWNAMVNRHIIRTSTVDGVCQYASTEDIPKTIFKKMELVYIKLYHRGSFSQFYKVKGYVHLK